MEVAVQDTDLVFGLDGGVVENPGSDSQVAVDLILGQDELGFSEAEDVWKAVLAWARCGWHSVL